PLPFGFVWYLFGGGLFWMVAALGSFLAISRLLPRRAEGARFDGVIAATTAAHGLAALAILVDFAIGLYVADRRDQIRDRHGDAEEESGLNRPRMRRNVGRIL